MAGDMARDMGRDMGRHMGVIWEGMDDDKGYGKDIPGELAQKYVDGGMGAEA
jgi:hypothetical protein